MTQVVALRIPSATPVEQPLPTAIEIDLNVRVRGNETFARFADADGALAVGELVEVYESESELVGEGRVTEIDPVKGLVFMSVLWASLQPGKPQRHAQSGDAHGMLFYGLVNGPGFHAPWVESDAHYFTVRSGASRCTLPAPTHWIS